ncbi:MAG: hypothetical protein GY820_06435 [Gammaproteobacteria bacterium]|nr:hypothetical protein [Gammaproteobacteria bacterium]
MTVVLFLPRRGSVYKYRTNESSRAGFEPMNDAHFFGRARPKGRRVSLAALPHT